MNAFTRLPGRMSAASRFLTCSATVFMLVCSTDAVASYESISTLPPHPTTETEVQLTISGSRPDSCHRVSLASITKADNHFTVTMSGVEVGGGCYLMVLDYDITTSLGKLPAGTYTVTSTSNVDWIENIGTRYAPPVKFVVTAPPLVRAPVTNIVLDLLLD